MKSYKVKLYSGEDMEGFEVNGGNIAELIVYDNNGNDITNKSKAQLILSKNGL